MVDDPNGALPSDPADHEEHPFRDRLARHPKLGLGARIALFVIGWTLLLIGIAGLVLPGIQGVLTILVGAALLSLVSETVYRLLKRAFHRWPALWDRLDRMRHKVHDWLSKKE